MLPKNGLKVVLKDESILVKCTPIKMLKTGNGSRWQMWCGTVVVRGQGGFAVGTRIIISEKHFAKVFPHEAPAPEPKTKRPTKRKPFDPDKEETAL